MKRSKNPSLTAARKAKRIGISKDEYIDIGTKAIEKAAQEDRWRPSERAASIADVLMTADDVWGKETAS